MSSSSPTICQTMDEINISYHQNDNAPYHLYGETIALIGLAFTGSIGMTLVILGCALPNYGNWWPFFVTLFYILSPLPTMLARHYQDDIGGSSNNCKEMALFITSGIVISAFGLPLVLAHAPASAPVIQWGACILTLFGNIVTFLTILGFFIAFDNDDEGYSMW